jgi:hypothetical protein
MNESSEYVLWPSRDRHANYFTLSRSMNAEVMMIDGGFAATVFPVISGYRRHWRRSAEDGHPH